MVAKKKKQLNAMMPRPVHPNPVRTHGLFGMSFVNQHMMVDDHWMPNSLTEEFKGVADLLSKRLVFSKLENHASRKNCIKDSRNLKRQCRDGRAKLQLCLHGNNTLQIRNYLINHKDMQRLYQKMPVHQVIDNINQRTFVMRKERDRLSFRLKQLKEMYACRLDAKANLENRIKYENEFELDEEKKSKEFRKKITNSHIRLKAIKTINSTYRKMIQVLRHDAIFYEPILRSLTKDTEDQATFIKHILFMGMPAIAKFKELSEEYRQMEDKSRKSVVAKQHTMGTFRSMYQKRLSQTLLRPHKTEEVVTRVKRYVRETPSMMFLKAELEAIENTIKQVKFATLCSQAKEIYPRMKVQVENNEKLKKQIENDIMGFQTIGNKMKRADVLSGVLVNNLSEEELARKERIRKLQEALAAEDQYEQDTILHMKNRSHSYVMLRFSLWNLGEILRHVDRPTKVTRIPYPNSYLRLPLLKFEMLTMRACPPEIYEENLDALMHNVKRKLYRLMKAYRIELHPEKMTNYRDEYTTLYLDSVEAEDFNEGKEDDLEVEEILGDTRMYQSVPSRKQIKSTSARLVEELSKKDD